MEGVESEKGVRLQLQIYTPLHANRYGAVHIEWAGGAAHVCGQSMCVEHNVITTMGVGCGTL